MADYYELNKVCAVASSSICIVEHTVTNGNDARIEEFYGESPVADETYIQLSWGDDTGGWEDLWVIWASEPLKKKIEYNSENLLLTGDGTKKIKLTLNNNTESEVRMAGYVKIRES